MAFEIKDGILIKCDEKNGDIVIPEGVTKIQEKAFSGFNTYNSITLPDSLETIENHAFDYCGFTAVYVSSLEKWLSICFEDLFSSPMQKGGSDLFINGKKLENLVLPDGVTKADNDRFVGCNSLTSVVLPDSVVEIGDRAFESCKNLLSINLPIGLKKIGYAAFDGCAKLTEMVIPDTVDYIGWLAFCGCTELSHIRLPENLKTIEHSTFKNCTNLRNIDLPESITEIKGATFSCCGIEQIDLPSGMTTIEEGLFKGSKLVEIQIPEGITEIKSDAFSGCTNLEVVYFPTSLKKIAWMAFSGGCKLKEIRISDLQHWYQIELGGSIMNGTDLIVGGKKLSSEELIVGMDSIPEKSFDGCNNFVHLVIPPEVKGIGNNAFSDCHKLESVEIQGNTEIGSGAFSYCENLKEVKLANGITIIGDAAFSNCTSLKGIDLPTGIDAINDDTFSGCKCLESIIVPDGVKTIGKRAFDNCVALTNISIPNTVTSIKNTAFQRCSMLKKIDLPSSLEIVANSLFQNSGLEECILPEGVKKIETNVFYMCRALKVISIPSTVTEVNWGAFSNLDHLEKIIIRCDINVIDRRNFKESKEIKEVYISETQIEEAKKMFKKVQFYNLDGEMIGKPKKATSTQPKPKANAAEKKEKKESPKAPAKSGISVCYPDNTKVPNSTVAPIVMAGGKAKGFAKPDIKELTVNMDGTEFFVVYKVASKIPTLWRRYYQQKDSEMIYDPDDALSKAEESGGYIHDGTGVYVTSPLQGNIPDDATPLSADEIEKRLCKFVEIINLSVTEEYVKKIFKEAQKKKNGKLYKGRVLQLSFLDLVDSDGTTFALVAKNEDDIQLCVELRSNVPVSDELYNQTYLFEE